MLLNRSISSNILAVLENRKIRSVECFINGKSGPVAPKEITSIVLFGDAYLCSLSITQVPNMTYNIYFPTQYLWS